MINARSETLVERPAFRDLVPGRRCVVPADGFYEWRREGEGKQPYYVRRPDEGPLALAGLWDAWERPEGCVESCTVITAPANRLLLPLHDRMPVLLDEEGVDLWLDGSVGDPARALEALGPSEAVPLEVFRVSRRVNGIRHDDAELIEPEGPPVRDADAWEGPASREAKPEQLGLF
ncbi:MAG: SOS response-associated peptidase, partial [Gemmatimonadota bacterium]|nr:SOS response-associated peptidase [Gemmatimonadota bacterium]